MSADEPAAHVAPRRLIDDDEGCLRQAQATFEGDPGTSGGNPGTSGGNPGTSEGNPGTSEGNPATFEGDPATSEGNPGTSTDNPETSESTIGRVLGASAAGRPRRVAEDPVPPDSSTPRTPRTEIGTLPPSPADVAGPRLNPRTGEPRRPHAIQVATVLCLLAVAATAVSVFWVYWDAVYEFAHASWLMGQFVTEPGSLQRVLLAVAVTVAALGVGVSNTITGYYAWTGYGWTRISGIISAALSFLGLLLNPAGWAAIPLAVIGAGLLWLPASKDFFASWKLHRHPQPVFSEPVTQVYYGPLPRYQKV